MHGDRLWFENQGFDAKVLNQIEHTTLSDIIARNTDTKYLQDDAFVFYNRHSGTAGGVASEDPDAPQLVIGSNGTDTLVGGPQGDMLVAGKGHQTMTGGGGNDQFVFDKGATRATITDYEPGRDTLVFENAGTLDYRDVHINSRNGDAVVNVGNDQIVLVGVNANQLNAHDFIFNSGDTVSHAHAATGVTVNLSTPSAQNTVGAGTTISAGTTLELASASSAAVTFTGSTGTLKLDNSASFTGTVAGLTAQDKIDFADISSATVQQPTFSGNASGGTLTVTDGTHTANVALLGNYLASTFVPSSDGHSGTSVVDQPSAQALVAQPHHA